MKPCVDELLVGCRPFGIDATCLHGKYSGKLASATGVDGHNWSYHVAYDIFDSETEDNWKWLAKQLHKAIGSLEGLVICIDASKGLETVVGAVFSEAKYRECMKHYQGDVFTDHLYPATRSYIEGLFKWHMQRIYAFAPDAMSTWSNITIYSGTDVDFQRRVNVITRPTMYLRVSMLRLRR